MRENFIRRAARLAVLTVGLLFACSGGAFAQSKVKDVLTNYANIAEAIYADSLATGKKLQTAVNAFLAKPTEETLKAAREAWIAARVPYQQSEAYRFGNTAVDDWEGKVNAWPLDEGLIDYVDESYGTSSDTNDLYNANVISSKSLTIGGKQVDTTEITKELIADTLHEAGKVEANVATGYHVIEFLLWGQDTNGTGPGAGKRPATDFDAAKCTGGNCDRRAAYLKTATDLLVDDLSEMAGQWKADGKARETLLADEKAGIVSIFTGLGSLSYGELAGERMKLGLILHDPEEEHDCFSDNTHNSHYYDVMGIRNVYLGSYKRVDGSEVKGASVSDLVKEKSAEADKAVREKLDATLAAFTKLKERAEKVEAYDQMIGEQNDEGNAVVQGAIDSLLDQTKAIERAVAVLDLDAITFEGSDSLDNPTAVGTAPGKG
jgi:putative iron-regulated protein